MADEEMAFVERVARAIYHGGRPKKAWDDRAEEYKEAFRVQARFAIDAMRDPTDKMVEIGCAAQDEADGDICTDYGMLAAYVAMIDAALKETA